MVFGVSPAWFISLFGEGFSVKQAGESLGMLRRLGFSSWQPEIFTEEGFSEWVCGNAEDLRCRSHDLGLNTEIFVAHLLGSCFESESELANPDWTDKLRRILDSLKNWTEITTVAVPLPQFKGRITADGRPVGKAVETALNRLLDFARIVESEGRILALEAMPGNLFGGSDRLLRTLERAGMEKVGINYDTGHFHAAGEQQNTVLENLGTRIVATHICDNDSLINLSLPPGDGTISWEDVVSGLIRSGYKGSYDIEIRCPAEAVESAYLRGREHLERYLLKESA